MKLKTTTLLLSLFLNVSLIACSCIHQKMDLNEYIGINVIFEGQLIDRNTLDGLYIEYVFLVKSGIMNSINGDTLKITTSSSESMCGLTCRKDEEWIIYAYLHNGLLRTDMCTRSEKVKISLNPWTSLKRHKRYVKKYIGFNGIAKDNSARGKLINGKPTGIWEIYSGDRLFRIENFSDNGTLHGLSQQFLSNGSRYEHFYQNGILIWYKTYDKEGELSSEKIITAPNTK